MPNFGVGDVPVQISQTGTQEALIKNMGNSTLFLDQYSSVSEGNHGLSLAPFSSVNWAAGRDLWAVTAPGEATSITVLYGATGTSLSEVSAVVTGDVTATIDGPVDANITNAVIPVSGTVDANITNADIAVTGTVDANITNADIAVTGTVDANITNANIDATVTGNIIVDSGEVNVGGILTPVEIQGGAVVLFSEEVVVPAASSVNVIIPGPVNGNTMYGVDVSWELLLSGAGFTASTVSALNRAGTIGTQATAVRDTGANEIGEMGFPEEVSFTVPMKKDYPLTVRISNAHATSALTGFLEVVATSYASPFPLDTMDSYFGVGTLVEEVTNPVSGNYITLPASMSTLKYRIQANAAGLDNVALSQWSSGSSFASANFRLSRSPYYQQTGAGGAFDIQEFATGPFGRPHRLTFFANFTGIVRLQLYGVER